MAWTVLHGPPGLEGITHWTLGDNGLYLNNLDESFSQPAFPRIELDKVVGLHSRTECDDNREPNTARIGDRPLRSFQRAKTVGYIGRVQAKNLGDLRLMQSIMRAVFTEDSSDDGLFVCHPHPDIGGTALRYVARCLSLDMDDDQDPFSPGALPTPYQRNFALTVRQSDPRYYADGDLSETAEAASAATVTATNAGLARTDPIITGTYGGSGTITLENLSIPDPDGGNVKLVIDAGLPAGELTVNFYANPRTAILQPVADDPVDAVPLLTTETWWAPDVPGLKPANTSGGTGANSIKVTGLSDWTVSWRNATW